ncbi:DUF927 domain-containing protein [Mesorhizobium sp.]|uniref:DUF927 domain-containing protein n=1 Tax=Mesorhizobium sp. TaxID=1871066 RepID=UPI000FE4CEA0|nr:DUF927 domain-containing protein [Mesorhizobium sp.]RWO81523.1 MAG: DUF927 domain-containing protein [Mesorhizobium sp.]
MPKHPTHLTNSQASKWSARRLKHERTGALSIEFTVPTGEANGTLATCRVGNEMTHSEILRELRKYTGDLRGPTGAKRVEQLLDQLPDRYGVLTDRPGWNGLAAGRPKVFITPARTIGLARRNFVWLPDGSIENLHIGMRKGDLESWNQAYGRFARASDYVAFSIMCGLSGPLLRFANLPELPCFNLFGESSVGKTTAARTAAAVFGNPKNLQHWGKTERALEEAAAGANDLVLVLNAAERMSLSKKRDTLNFVVHQMVEGRSFTRTRAVDATLPDLSWRTLILSTSNHPGQRMATDCGLSWAAQEIARFNDIAVPPAASGGIFNRDNAEGLIEELEDALDNFYGSPFRPWLLFLLRENPHERVGQLIAEFADAIEPRSNLEKRVARKFGLVYAAGTLAVEADILAWPDKRPFNVVRRLFSRWRRQSTLPNREDALGEFKKLLELKGAVIKAASKVTVPDASRFIGVKAIHKGKQVFGFSKQGLERSLGHEHASSVLSWLKGAGLIFGRSGSLEGIQLPITFVIEGRRKARPRLLLVDPLMLKAKLAER